MSFPPPPPPTNLKKFEKAKSALDNLTARDAPQEIITSTFSDATEKRAFLKWYLYTKHAQFSREETRLAARQPLTIGQYHRALTAIDWTLPDPTATLYHSMYSSSKNGAEPIRLGIDQEYCYYLQPERCFQPTRRDPNMKEAEHPSVYEMRSVVTRAPAPFKFGYCLGLLCYRWIKAPDTAPLKLTALPFHVYLDVVSDVIWMVFSPNFKDELGEEVPLGGVSNIWESLPSPSQGRQDFKAIRLVDSKSLLGASQSKNYPLLTREVMATVFDTLLQPWIASRSEVMKAVAAKGRPGHSSGEGFERKTSVHVLAR